jgi:hypothetical protein
MLSVRLDDGASAPLIGVSGSVPETLMSLMFC